MIDIFAKTFMIATRSEDRAEVAPRDRTSAPASSRLTRFGRWMGASPLR